MLSLFDTDSIWEKLALIAFGLIILALVGLICFLIVYGITWAFTPYGPIFEKEATVKALSYKGAETHFGTGISASGDVVMTSNPSYEQYNVVLTFPENDYWILDSKSLFHAVNQGDKLLLRIRGKTVLGEVSWDLVDFQRID